LVDKVRMHVGVILQPAYSTLCSLSIPSTLPPLSGGEISTTSKWSQWVTSHSTCASSSTATYICHVSLVFVATTVYCLHTLLVYHQTIFNLRVFPFHSTPCTLYFSTSWWRQNIYNFKVVTLGHVTRHFCIIQHSHTSMRIYHVILLMLPQPCIVYVCFITTTWLLSTHTSSHPVITPLACLSSYWPQAP
jgi:hypothetical protein